MQAAGKPTFDVTVCRLHFTSRGVLAFPPAMASNVVRGVFGAALFSTPAYARIFAPRAAAGPSGLKDVPRPFVLRAEHLDGLKLEAGAPFHIGVHLFLAGEDALGWIRDAFAHWRGAELRDVETSRVSVPLELPSGPVDRLRVLFLTPTELKSGEKIVERPDFPVLFARARDRVSTLRAAYGTGALDIDFAGMAERAALVRAISCDIERTFVERLSKASGQRHPLSGFTGCAVYAGELREFMPILRAAEWTGVGRQTVWGHGAIRVEV